MRKSSNGSPNDNYTNNLRRGSADSFQTVKIRRSDLDEIRNRYSLRFKDKEGAQKKEEEEEEEKVEDNKSNISKYSKYSSNMRRKEKARSSSAGSSVQSRGNYTSQSKARWRQKERAEEQSKREEEPKVKHL